MKACHAPVGAPTRGPVSTLAVCLLLVAVTLAIYVQALDFGFAFYDDPFHVLENTHVTGGLTRRNIEWAFVPHRTSLWHPATWISYMVDHALFGLNPRGYHLVNLGLHAANALFLFLVLKSMTMAFWRSAFVAALFAVHPLNVEPVVWVSARKDLLAALFWFLTMAAYLGYVRRGGYARYGLLLLTFAVGLMTKPTLVILPMHLLLLDYWTLDRLALLTADAQGQNDPVTPSVCGPLPSRYRLWLRLLLEKLPFLMLALAVTIVSLCIHCAGVSAQASKWLPWHLTLRNALISYVRYLHKILWPQNLAFFYPFHTDRLPLWAAFAAGVFLTGISVLFCRARAGRPFLIVGWLWYVLGLLPVSGLIQVGSHAMADRYAYVPVVGIFVLGVWSLGELLGRQRRAVTAAMAAALVAALGVRSWFQVGHWRSDRALLWHALKATRDNYMVHTNIGLMFLRDQKAEEATSHFSQALRIDPQSPIPKNNLAWLLATSPREQLRNPQAAVRLAQEACRTTGCRKPEMLDTLAAAYAAAGRFDDAVRAAREALSKAQQEGQNNALVSGIEQRLRLYSGGRAYYDSSVSPTLKPGETKSANRERSAQLICPQEP
ncbi:MAG: hypothetical protein JXR37_37520 [Kiritimatiellae bacterium]|nr:hypothetical protein [Kiritimatiellia bacterium]